MVRQTPKLDLTPELTEPNSEDFNLFYKPETKPLPAGLEIFASSLTLITVKVRWQIDF